MIDDLAHLSTGSLSLASTSNRRRFLRNSGGLAALGAFSGALHAKVKRSRYADAVVLFRQRDPHSVAFAGILNKQGLPGVALEPDVVRQWRNGLNRCATGGQALPLMGLSNWSDFFMLRELAAEARKFPLVEVQLSANQYQRPDMLNQYAQQLLLVATNPKNRSLQNKVNRLSANNTQGRSLFAWVIG